MNHAGQVVLKLKTPYRDGTSHIVMSPLEFMQRLAALVPRPRLHLIRFHGVLAPHAKLRPAIVPIPAQRVGSMRFLNLRTLLSARYLSSSEIFSDNFTMLSSMRISLEPYLSEWQ